jgi:hypothetical protein
MQPKPTKEPPPPVDILERLIFYPAVATGYYRNGHSDFPSN